MFSRAKGIFLGTKIEIDILTSSDPAQLRPLWYRALGSPPPLCGRERGKTRRRPEKNAPAPIHLFPRLSCLEQGANSPAITHVHESKFLRGRTKKEISMAVCVRLCVRACACSRLIMITFRPSVCARPRAVSVAERTLYARCKVTKDVTKHSR